MYRNIFYNPHKGTVRLWTWDSEGRRVEYDMAFKPYIYLESQTVKDAKSIYNTHLQKREFKNQFERKKYVNQCGIKRIFYNIQAEQQYLLDTFGQLNQSPDFSKHALKIFYLDIETYSPDKFPEPSLAEDKINVITVFDSLSEKYHTFGLAKDYKPSKDNVVYHKCHTETDLLRRFIEFWSLDYPDIITGWNCEFFDIPYIINRVTNILGEDWAKKLSPVRKLYKREGIIKNFGKIEDKWYIKGISHIDYMEAYKVFSREPREKYSLDHIGEVELGEGKLAINATNLSKVADTDWQNFVDYNIQDVGILVGLEKKLKFLELVRMLAYLGCTSFESALGTIAIVTGAMALKAQEKGMIIPTFKTESTSNYAGGFVKEPNRGMKEGVISFDANSLYPNTIITLNLSPETKLGKIVSKTDKDISILLTNGKEYNLSHKEFGDFVRKEKVAISKAKILYSQKQRGFCPELVEKIYNQRVDNKNELKERKRAIAHCNEGSDKYNEHKRMINHLDIMQYTLKILMNRLYGTFANAYSPFYDIDAASSITLTGQACVKQSGDVLNKHLQETYNIDEDCVIYMDTDSCYFTIEPVLKVTGHKLLTESGKISKSAYDIAEKIEKYLNDEINSWAEAALNSQDCRFVFKRETICDVGIFLQKKRYILHVLDDEDIPVDKIKYVGVEVASSSTPKKVKTLIKNIVETMIKTKDYKKTNEVYKDAYEQFSKLKIEEIAFPKGINDYDKYGRQAVGFDTAKGTPIHVKSAIYYNQLLDKLNIANRYEKIRSGRKIKFFYTSPNKYNVKSIAFEDEYPKEFDIHPDMDKMFDKIVTKAVERLYNAIGWIVKKPNNEAACDLLELLG